MKSKIMVVDDEMHIRELVRFYLDKAGFDTIEAANAEEALDIVENQYIDLAVVDIMMPGMDGPQTLEQLVNLVDINVVPVAFMTAKVQPAEVEHYRSLGARDVIIKPFDPMQLASQIRAIWSLSNG